MLLRVLVLFCIIFRNEEALGKELSTFQVFRNTDYTWSGVGGMRDSGYGIINLTNLTGAVTKAYLYWHGPMTAGATNEAANAAVTVNGAVVPGTHIGLGSDNCWGSSGYNYALSRAYRADITSLVSSNGNSAYLLGDFMKPLGTNSKAINVNGASLVVFYQDGDPNNNKDVLVLDGNDSISHSPFPTNSPGYDNVGWTFQATGFTYRGGAAFVQLHVSDGQYFAPLDDGVMILDQRIVLEPAGHIFSGDTKYMPSANNGPTGNGCLWDIKSWNLESYLTNGQNTLSVSNRFMLADCTALIVAAVVLPAGSADPLPVISEKRFGPTGMSLTFTGGSAQAYSVWGSTNLVNWEVLGAVSQLSSNVFRFTDQVPLPPRRFYKLSTP
jgi:hypothetical protein